MSSITVTVYPEEGESVRDAVLRAFAILDERLERRERAKYAALRPVFSDELSEFDPSFDSGLEAY